MSVIYRSEEIKYFLVVPGRICSYYCRFRAQQHTSQKAWYSSSTSKPDASSAANKGHGKDNGWVGHLLVLSAGDIIRDHCRKHKQPSSSTLYIRGTKNAKSDTCATLLWCSVLCTYVRTYIQGVWCVHSSSSKQSARILFPDILASTGVPEAAVWVSCLGTSSSM